MLSISEFYRLFKDSLCREILTNLDANGAKRRVDYKLLKELFQKYFVVHEHSAVKNSLSTYVLCYAPDGLFWLNL